MMEEIRLSAQLGHPGPATSPGPMIWLGALLVRAMLSLKRQPLVAAGLLATMFDSLLVMLPLMGVVFMVGLTGVFVLGQSSGLLGTLLFFMALGMVLIAMGLIRKERSLVIYGFFCLGPGAMFLYAYWRLT